MATKKRNFAVTTKKEKVVCPNRGNNTVDKNCESEFIIKGFRVQVFINLKENA